MRTREIAAVMSAIADAKITRKQAAKRLGGISERHVNRLMKEHKVRRPPGKSRERAAEAQKRREWKVRAARAVIAKEYGVESAASAAGCSVRTMYRWIARIKKDAVSARKRRKSKKS